jgi:hypothetical protein
MQPRGCSNVSPRAQVRVEHRALRARRSAVAAVLAGIRRQRGVRPLRKAQPLELEPLARLVDTIDAATLAGLRDRAILLLGFVAALRRSELVALDVEDLQFEAARGLLVMIRRSKAEQEQVGAQVAVPYAQQPDRCAVRALRRYLDTARDPPRPRVPPAPPRRQPDGPPALRSVGRAHRQAGAALRPLVARLTAGRVRRGETGVGRGHQRPGRPAPAFARHRSRDEYAARRGSAARHRTRRFSVWISLIFSVSHASDSARQTARGAPT